jgi:hypothetical protein
MHNTVKLCFDLKRINSFWQRFIGIAGKFIYTFIIIETRFPSRMKLRMFYIITCVSLDIIIGIGENSTTTCMNRILAPLIPIYYQEDFILAIDRQKGKV